MNNSISQPMISVVMSTYDDADYLPESIESVIAQVFKDFEFIIVNDGSPDPETQEILHHYSGKDPRIKVIKKENEGLTKALIDGCAVARGYYLARIDVGDIMLSNRLQLQKNILDKYSDVGFVSCWTEFCAPEWEHLWVSKGEPKTTKPVDLIPEYPDHGLLGKIPHHGSIMFRKSIYQSVGGYRWQFYYGQDWDLWYRMAEKSKYYIIPKVLYKVRILPHCISIINQKRQEQLSECFKGAYIARFWNEDESPYLAKAEKIRPAFGGKKIKKNQEYVYYFIAENLRFKDTRDSRKYFFRAIKANVFSLRSYIRLIQIFFSFK